MRLPGVPCAVRGTDLPCFPRTRGRFTPLEPRFFRGPGVSGPRVGVTADTEDPVGFYLGTNTGQLYASRDAGPSSKAISPALPPVRSVSAGVARWAAVPREKRKKRRRSGAAGRP